MVDYNSLKVAELKEELKKRGIPSTGLTRKQQIVDRLVQHDDENGTADDGQKEDLKDDKGDAGEEEDKPEDRINDAQNGIEKDATTDAPPEKEQPKLEEVKEATVDAESKTEQVKDAPVDEQPTEQEPKTEVEAETIDAQTTEQQPEPEVAKNALEEANGDAQVKAETTQEQPAPTIEPEMPTQTPTLTADVNMEHADSSAPTAPVAQPAEAIATTQDDVQEPASTPLDTLKRKRRSVTPPLSAESVNKKLKQADEESNGQLPQLQQDVLDEKADRNLDMPDVPVDATPDATVQPMATSDDVMDATHTAESTMEDVHDEPSIRRPSATKAPRSPNHRRFKDIINPSAPTVHDSAAQHPTLDDGIEVSPALHPATRALYIRDLVRPINLNALRDHLTSLATPRTQDMSTANNNLVEETYVDTLKTHAFVLFDSISSASRARASLHARVWPAEATRKPLWVDFIPEDRMKPWIEQERAQGGARASSARRWDVEYRVLDDDEGGVDVALVEASGAAARGPPPFGAQGMPGAPSGPRNSIPSAAPRGPASSYPNDQHRNQRRPSSPPPARLPVTAKAVEESSASFMELDKIFRFTTTKPKLYWQPVSDELADRRLDEIDAETSRDWDPREDARKNPGSGVGRGLDQLRRYTFEDGDVLVDGGPEYGGGGGFGRGGGDGYRGAGGGGGGGNRRRGADRYR